MGKRNNDCSIQSFTEFIMWRKLGEKIYLKFLK